MYHSNYILLMLLYFLTSHNVLHKFYIANYSFCHCSLYVTMWLTAYHALIKFYILPVFYVYVAHCSLCVALLLMFSIIILTAQHACITHVQYITHIMYVCIFLIIIHILQGATNSKNCV